MPTASGAEVEGTSVETNVDMEQASARPEKISKFYGPWKKMSRPILEMIQFTVFGVTKSVYN